MLQQTIDMRNNPEFTKGYVRTAKYPIDVVIPMIMDGITSKTIPLNTPSPEVGIEITPNKRERKVVTRVEFPNGEFARTNSLRLQTFATKGLVCACCGLKASFFAMERGHSDWKHNKPSHINLYGVNDEGEEVIFTHDHIISRSNGGADALHNTQTMCGPCNWKKGNSQ